MSRDPRSRIKGHTRFPRVSGDEPISLAVQTASSVFSPRERG